MDPTVLRYVVFIVAALILIWAVFEMRTRLIRRKKLDVTSLNRWEMLDSTTPAHRIEEGSVSFIGGEDKQEEQVEEADIHARAQQNGHFIPTQKKL